MQGICPSQTPPTCVNQPVSRPFSVTHPIRTLHWLLSQCTTARRNIHTFHLSWRKDKRTRKEATSSTSTMITFSQQSTSQEALQNAVYAGKQSKEKSENKAISVENVNWRHTGIAITRRLLCAQVTQSNTLT